MAPCNTEPARRAVPLQRSADRNAVSDASPLLSLESGGQRWIASTAHSLDLSIPLDFAGAQPSFFGAAPAAANALEGGSFIGDVRRGGSCNCSSYSLTPHCNGTHTECVGHVTGDRVSVRDVAIDHLNPALLLTVTPECCESTQEGADSHAQAGDYLITRKALQSASANAAGYTALVVRTLPNGPQKLSRNYDTGDLPAYFSVAAMAWIVAQGVRHLVVDLPSIDRASDAGRLAAHRLFWGLPAGSTHAAAAMRPNATITELAYIDSAIADGLYLLNLQVAPFSADAAPSRPILYPVLRKEPVR
jgi:kynurenine formamidase